jgi:hypothetical protein
MFVFSSGSGNIPLAFNKSSIDSPPLKWTYLESIFEWEVHPANWRNLESEESIPDFSVIAE